MLDELKERILDVYKFLKPSYKSYYDDMYIEERYFDLYRIRMVRRSGRGVEYSLERRLPSGRWVVRAKMVVNDKGEVEKLFGVKTWIDLIESVNMARLSSEVI